MFVGDVILSAREAVPDLPGVIPTPQSELVIAPFTVGPGVDVFPAGTYYAVCTYTNPWGETDPSPEVQLNLNGSQIISVTIPAAFQQVMTGVNLYLGGSPGGEVQLYSTSVPFPTPFLVGPIVNAVASTPPLGNSAFMPDSGGSVASASQVFRWLTDGLNRLSSLNGGIPDMGGFATQTGKANYQVPGDWQTLSDAWYDGYPLDLSSSSLVFRHNTITALSGLMAYTQVADTLIVELFAQPQRVAGIAGLSAPMNLFSAVAQTSGMTGWVLPFGLAMLGTPPTYEIVAYTMSAGVLVSLVRGLGGTNAQAWPTGTPVTELNAMFKGLRAAQIYTVGQSLNTLRLPSSWVPLMHLYLLARYRRIEQQEQEAMQLMKEYEAGAKEATKKKPAVGDRQIQPQDSIAVDVYPLLSRDFGGGIIP